MVKSEKHPTGKTLNSVRQRPSDLTTRHPPPTTRDRPPTTDESPTIDRPQTHRQAQGSLRCPQAFVSSPQLSRRPDFEYLCATPIAPARAEGNGEGGWLVFRKQAAAAAAPYRAYGDCCGRRPFLLENPSRHFARQTSSHWREAGAGTWGETSVPGIVPVHPWQAVAQPCAAGGYIKLPGWCFRKCGRGLTSGVGERAGGGAY